MTRSQSGLHALVKKLARAYTPAARTMARDAVHRRRGALAIDGATVLIARSPQDIDAALDRHHSGRGISASRYAALMTGLAAGSLMQMFGDLTPSLSIRGALRLGGSLGPRDPELRRLDQRELSRAGD